MTASGYYDQIVPFTVKDFNNSLPQLTLLKIFMINSSVTTTTIQQSTTKLTTELTQNTSDGASTTEFFTITESTEAENKPINARQIGFYEESLASRNELHFCLLLIFIALCYFIL